MLAIAVGLLLIVAIAVCVMVLVALPHMRNGTRILTPDGERALTRAREQAIHTPVAAAGGTVHGVRRVGGALGTAGGRIARAWHPVSVQLHGLFDQLESRDSRSTSSGPIQDDVSSRPAVPAPELASPELPGTRQRDVELPPAYDPQAATQPAPQGVRRPPEPAEPDAPLQHTFDIAAIVGNRVGRPRPVPPVSGPIPEVDAQAGSEPAAEASAGTRRAR